MEKFVPLGDEALAQGALDAGISGFYAYPGTPSTEIMEYAQRAPDAAARGVHRSWSANEKTAFEAALGMSYAGKRALVSMKHVGLNVAADPFMNAAMTGVNGGLLVVSADDPSMHSSQNEQDSRFYGRFALIPTLEPADQQEAYDLPRYAFDLSERYGIPVLVRITTRLAHSRAPVTRRDAIAEHPLALPKDRMQFVLLPAAARRKYAALLGKQADFEAEAEQSFLNRYEDGPDKSLGIIACGIAYNYLKENYRTCPYPVLKIGQYPLPRKLVARLFEDCAEILVLEEGMPVVEDMLRGFPLGADNVHGRLDGRLPRTGELNPGLVGKALGLPVAGSQFSVPDVVVGRPPQLCDGCPHGDTYRALKEALESYGDGRVFSDIGCYTLGALPPLDVGNACVDMGASITMAKGAADAGLIPTVAVIGDSTFSHSGITGLLDLVNAQSPVTVIIMDNETTGMTGGQNSAAQGHYEQIAVGIGVAPEHVRVITPLPKQHAQNVATIQEELAYEGVSVIISRRECIETAKRKRRG